MRTPARRLGRRQRRLATIAQLVAVVLAVCAAVTVVAEGPGGHPGADRLAAEEIPALPLLAAPLPPSAVPSPSGSPVVPSSPPPVLRLAGPVPTTGTGRFGYDDRSGPVLGRAGELRRYRVAVELGSGEDAAAFGRAVHTALAGPGSWVDSGRLRLRQVPGGEPRDFTVYLATARTAGRMCADGGVDIRVGGRPYTSCRAPGKVIINLDRWRLSVPHFVSARAPLEVYRTYVVNHEVGHQLGHRHERCPGVGRPAPVMMQQTLFLRGCRINPWPYLDGRRYAGPAL
ncbi:hypothetical protein DKT68_25115 [Micromonospora acroterricola]|uniref:DUF3152 domain-containing protein n=1 Tax=Micromonospora acroterricola TaxID=2202421 RepID=A0A317CZN0_9ACTN|nr:DUF3152 domain-containing protein [Micromonospora acroterricola]PWR05803.1 hypothetical protein DKT68_25115 [Micromonospora acroterricola]